MHLSTRYKLVGVEVLGFGFFVLLLLFLEYIEAGTNPIVQDFSWVWGIVGITLILVGLEMLSLNSKVFGKSIKTE